MASFASSISDDSKTSSTYQSAHFSELPRYSQTISASPQTTTSAMVAQPAAPPQLGPWYSDFWEFAKSHKVSLIWALTCAMCVALAVSGCKMADWHQDWTCTHSRYLGRVANGMKTAALASVPSWVVGGLIVVTYHNGTSRLQPRTLRSMMEGTTSRRVCVWAGMQAVLFVWSLLLVGTDERKHIDCDALNGTPANCTVLANGTVIVHHKFHSKV